MSGQEDHGIDDADGAEVGDRRDLPPAAVPALAGRSRLAFAEVHTPATANKVSRDSLLFQDLSRQSWQRPLHIIQEDPACSPSMSSCTDGRSCRYGARTALLGKPTWQQARGQHRRCCGSALSAASPPAAPSPRRPAGLDSAGKWPAEQGRTRSKPPCASPAGRRPPGAPPRRLPPHTSQRSLCATMRDTPGSSHDAAPCKESLPLLCSGSSLLPRLQRTILGDQTPKIDCCTLSAADAVRSMIGASGAEHNSKVKICAPHAQRVRQEAAERRPSEGPRHHQRLRARNSRTWQYFLSFLASAWHGHFARPTAVLHAATPCAHVLSASLSGRAHRATSSDMTAPRRRQGRTETAPSVRPRLPTRLMSARNNSRPAYCTDEPTPVTARQATSAGKPGAQPVPSSPVFGVAGQAWSQTDDRGQVWVCSQDPACRYGMKRPQGGTLHDW